MRRGAFIGRCLEVQEAFSFVAPSEVLGSTNLASYTAVTSLKACYPTWAVLQPADHLLEPCSEGCVPRSAHTVYVRWLSAGHTSLKEDLAARWPKCFRSLVTVASPLEVIPAWGPPAEGPCITIRPIRPEVLAGTDCSPEAAVVA